MPESLDQRFALPVESGVLLWCLRIWVVGIRRNETEADLRIQRMLALLGAPGAAPYLEGLMFAIGHGATRPVHVHCVCAPEISEDERALLDVVALAQDSRPFEALLLLRSMLTAEAARAVLRSAEEIGTALARAGRWLPAPEAEVRQFALATGCAYPGAADTIH